MEQEGWVLKNWCFWIVILERTLESSLEIKMIKPVNPKGNQPWIFIGRVGAEAKATMLWPSDVKSWFIGKNPDPGRNWGQAEKGAREDKMVRWHHWLNEREFEQTPRDSEGQRSKACCSSRGSQGVEHDLVTE